MVTLTKKNKALIIATVAIAIVLAISLPYVYAAPAAETDPTQIMRNLYARGIAVQKIDDQNVKSPANFTLTLTPTEATSNVKKFDVVSGTVVVNGVTYTITGGNGAALPKKHVILLQATGTDPDGQEITLKLAGRYFWMGGHLFVVRMAGKLQTDNGNYLLLMRAAIRV